MVTYGYPSGSAILSKLGDIALFASFESTNAKTRQSIVPKEYAVLIGRAFESVYTSLGHSTGWHCSLMRTRSERFPLFSGPISGDLGKRWVSRLKEEKAKSSYRE
jgi:hypothetical protein